MDQFEALRRVAHPLADAITLTSGPKVEIRDAGGLRERIPGLVRTAVLDQEPHRSLARWLIRELALATGAIPASIHDLYAARGQGKIRLDYTVPALNLRALPFQAARRVFRAAAQADAQALIFELARSEMGYTDQPPAEYAACILGAAVAEGYRGPVFIQGDHFQASAKKYAQKPDEEVGSIRKLTEEAIAAGFFNIDIDTSTLVDLTKATIPEQQEVNTRLSAELTVFIRKLQPKGVQISIGAEIGEVGGHNSTEPELRGFMDEYRATLGRLDGKLEGVSKISVQTGTSHGGVVLPDGTIAKVKVDFETLARLSKVAREVYGLGGAVQHGASTLPEDAFAHFPKAGTLEVHLATNFQNMLYDRLPADLLARIYKFLEDKHADERKPDMTDEQFHYSSRKRALGPFKADLWALPPETLSSIEDAWQAEFKLLFDKLNIHGTREEVSRYIKPVPVHTALAETLREAGVEEDAKDLAD